MQRAVLNRTNQTMKLSEIMSEWFIENGSFAILNSMTMQTNSIVEKVEAFEKRYLIKFKLSFEMCNKLGLQRKRLNKILKGEIEPTYYECMVFDKFLKLPRE